MSLVMTKVKGTIEATAIASADTLITNASTYDTFSGSFIFYNTHTSSVNVYVAAVNQSGGSPGTPATSDIIWSAQLKEVTDVGNNWAVFDVTQALTTTNDTLVVYASTTDVVNYGGCYARIPDQS